jgi:DNA invertase Pin-like site-specific DNA recombinase
VKFGRPLKLNTEEAALARRMKSNGETATTICRTLGIGRTTLYRQKAGTGPPGRQ